VTASVCLTAASSRRIRRPDVFERSVTYTEPVGSAVR
jgi:hypothetical protein